ncbi:hypothetical protein SMC26_31465 [Actinomadura fulvescens]|uniref:Phage protein n=1 Tax=Actinomadura fulvescens TaxID=46160 RepID=A0ABP6C9N9_9ACTN
MAGLMTKIKAWSRSPQGQRTRAKAERMARDPRNKEKARRLLTKFRGKGGKGRRY